MWGAAVERACCSDSLYSDESERGARTDAGQRTVIVFATGMQMFQPMRVQCGCCMIVQIL